MITEDRLTAYALDEVPDAERAAIQAHLAEHADARQFVEQTRSLAAALTASLAAEAVPMVTLSAPAAVTMPRNRAGMWAALAASVLVAAGLGVYANVHNQQQKEYASRHHRESGDGTVALFNGDGGLDSEFKSGIEVVRGKQFGPGVTSVGGTDPSKTGDNPPVGLLSQNNPIAGVVVTPTANFNVTALPALNPAKGPVTNPGKPLTVSGATRHTVTALGDATALGTLAPGIKGPSVPMRSKGIKGDDYSKGKSDGLSDKPGDKPEPENRSYFEARLKQQSEPGFGGGSYDRFPALVENDFVKVDGQNALSTFGVDVDTASYSIVRKFLSQNTLPPQGAVRLEEMVNYFPYRDAAPSGPDPFAVTVEMAECPWASKNKLARIGLKAKPIDYANRPASNLVFLVDVSGSMEPENRLPLVKQSLKLLVEQLTENDRVALVTYASGTGVSLDSTSATKKSVILDAIDNLRSGGSTNGAGGIHLAYQVAVANFVAGGTNRVILCTDGDWNVGTSSTDELIKLIEEKRKSNVFLSVFGFGMGNLRDEMMVNLAGKGNGNYAYIDTIKEARKALVEQLGGTLVTVAKDVKIQVEFNPAKVGAYRLLGYEKRKLAAEDFHNDAKDAGEMGAGHVVTALYELTPAGESPVAGVDALRYQAAPKNVNESKEAFVVKLRHKLPEGDKSTLREVAIQDVAKPYGEASEDFRFAAAVASFSMLLRDSPYKGNATYAAVIELANAAKGWDPGAYRAEFIEMATKAKAIANKP